MKFMKFLKGWMPDQAGHDKSDRLACVKEDGGPAATGDGTAGMARRYRKFAEGGEVVLMTGGADV